MAEHKMSYAAADGAHELVGILTRPPAGVAARGEAVVLVHGGMANKNSFYHKHLASKLASELGYHVFRFDFVGNGESFPIFKKAADGTETTEAYRNMMSGFWLDVDDLAWTCEYLAVDHGLKVACAIGHSRGGQVCHMMAVKHGARLGIPRIVGCNMRYNLEYWRASRCKAVAEHGHWTLGWRNRGQPVEHRVSAADIDIYAGVPMHQVRLLTGVRVLNCYGLLSEDQPRQAAYDTGAEPLTDGVVPFADVEPPSNLIPDHTLRFLPNVGHYYREPGSADRLWHAIRAWLLDEGAAGFSML